MERTITIQQIKDAAQEAYNLYKDNTDGKNADYIPYLANIDPKLFGISICLMNGEIIQLGDSQYRFGIESVSKVLTAILVLRQYGAPKVLEMIGADATGLPFNSIMAILLENDHPSTPLVNAGAISADSMVQPLGNSDGKWKAIVDNMTELCGSAPQLIDELYKSESATNFNNRSIAWLLKNYNRIYDDPDMSLDLYTRQCSMGITAEQLSICGATIANEGLNPNTNKQVFDKALAPKITSMIATVGFYQAHRRLALHLRNPCQDRRRRRCDGCDAGCNGYFGLRASFGRCRQLRKSAACHQIYYEQTGHERIQRAPHPRAIIYSILTEKPIFLSPREKYRLFN